MGSGRASKKKKQLIEVPSSVYAVISNDDLLIEILLRLPANSSILPIKSVSKRWLSLIRGPVSTIRCSQNPNVEPPSGLFLQPYISGTIHHYVTFNIRSQVNRSPQLNTAFRFGFPNENIVEILQSCNGLFLCRVSNPDTTHYSHYVYNPSTNNWSKRLPPCHNYSEFNNKMSIMRLAFDPIKSPYYKVVFAGTKRDYDREYDYIQIQTYSSETGTWSICPEKFPAIFEFIFFRHAIYWNNAFHWIHDICMHSKLDVEHLDLTTIQPPDHVLDMIHCRLFESRDCLLFLCDYTDTRRFDIYEMSKGCSGWSMKYHVNVDDVMKLSPLFERRQHAIIRACYRVLSIVLGEKEEDSFLVMEICGKVVQYKVVLETIRELYDCGPIHYEFPGLNRGCYPYYASFASV